MTVDERLEKLVGRHEALTQTVGLMARDMQDMKSGIDGLKSSMDILKSSVDGVRSYTSEIAEATARLLHIAQIHEHRITRIEGEQ